MKYPSSVRITIYKRAIFNRDVQGLRKFSEALTECQRTPKPAKTFCRFGVFSYYLEVSATGLFAEDQSAEKACTASVFAFLRNLPATVSIYADAGKLLVFGAPLTSGSLSKNEFFDRLARPPKVFGGLENYHL